MRAERSRQILDAIDSVLLGKPVESRLSLCCLLAGGHLLIEDLPGMGKTTLAQGLSRIMGFSFSRIQFTSDMLPGDILGASIPDASRTSFVFRRGPVFAQVVLADEINRASAKTQSALLEAMEERQVSMDGEVHALPEPFFVIATQNPLGQAGTQRLPESQLDRFLMRVSLGYPTPDAERRLLAGLDTRQALASLQPLLDLDAFRRLRGAVREVVVREPLLDYVQRLVAATRSRKGLVAGLSPRAAIGLVSASRAMALISGRTYVIPDDVQAVFVAVAGHRLLGTSLSGDGSDVARRILEETDVLA
jgi:MoxR-like ATPase